MGIAVVVIVAGYAAYSLVLNRPAGATKLVVYTYSSLFSGSCGSGVNDSVFGPFERAHHVSLQFVCPSGTLVSTLAAERNARVADVVIGLDELTAPQAEARGLLVPYASPELRNVPTSLVSQISPGHFVTPYEYGFLAIDYLASFYNSTHGAIAQSAFPSFAGNTSWAGSLMIEDPTTDITGEEYLAWQIEFYSSVLHTDWQSYWKAVAHYVQVAPDWSTAFQAFSTPGSGPMMVVSYASDAAYAAANGGAGSFNVTLSHWNGTTYGWKSVYGIGIVNGSSHADLGKALIDWMLGGSVQSQIPTNEWEYPANVTVSLPAVYSFAPDPASVSVLNDATSPAALAQALPNWLTTWQTLENQYG